MPKKKKATPTSSYIIAILIVIILILLGLLYLNSSNTNSASSTTLPGSTTSTTGISGNQNNTHSLHTKNGISQGGVIPDTIGSTGATTTTISIPPQNEWQYSSNGSIVLQFPTQNTAFVSGQPIVGLSSITPVSFLLVDNTVGKIAGGTLNVVNGKFDSSIEFTPHSKSGVLQIYHPNPSNGAEQDIININVNFQ